MDNKRYLLWNNKGGVGKTFLSYNLAIEYAILHPEEDVVVVDACPQTNVSEMILGGNGAGAEKVNELADKGLTIAGYIKERFNRSPQAKLGSEPHYFIHAKRFNHKMPENVHLLCGDMDLDICSQLINHMGISPVRKAWENSRTLLKDLIESFENARKLESNRPQTFFIDCNPSFANYTENAILAANRVIIPCTADAASIRGIKNLFSLMFNVSIENKPLSDEFIDFYENVEKSTLSLPKVHLFIQNRSRSLDKSATKAFQYHADEIARLVKQILHSHPKLFTQLLENNLSENQRVAHIKDGNTLAAIINHEGSPLSHLKHDKYEIYGQPTQANADQIQALTKDIQHVLTLI
ncbi:ParA family protein [Alysiella filiformis]|uniref:Cellulose biosynthesis protein BcsQ n=1 Tax=Alysiella filiformis DSM 16848 TaxID=1120981 RepID=A0A286E252_9NEIS|nr:ParA family protein [Alysiella filiformis]QMT30854.1 ParA family protein [Alysiella filiformis]UBQ56164.1 AAA family ATPase [Alysiella filiformis DSM 16848]SOD64977.1 Cellulose biosynthesis protein BcsQ [Alysiella filiformis DSM 16848]